MISAMPAVAVRRERKKPRSLRSGSASRRSSAASLSRARSASTVYSQAGPWFYHEDTVCGLTREHLRLLIYFGTVFLVTGLVLVFIGVGTEASATHSIGLGFIAIGAVLCLLKLFFSESRNLRKKAIALPKASPLEGNYIVVPISKNNSEAQHKPNSTQESNSTTITPSSLNSIPETHILITDEKNRF